MMVMVVIMIMMVVVMRMTMTQKVTDSEYEDTQDTSTNIDELPVVPHEAVAEVSRRGKL